MQFNRRNINKRLRNGDIISSSLYSTSSSGGGSSSGGVLSGNYLPATQNPDGTYTVNLTQVNFNGNVIASGEVSAFRIGSSSATTGTSTSGTVTIYDGLDSDSALIALSANQGRILKELIQSMSGGTSINIVIDEDSLSNNQILVYNSTTKQWENKSNEGVSEITKLKDVQLTTLSDKQILQYDSASSKWINKTFDLESSAMTQHIADTVKHITADERNKWNSAVTSSHTHSNKTVLDKITDAKLTNWDGVVANWDKAFYFDKDGNLRVKLNLIGEKEVSAYGSGSSTSSGALTIVDNLNSTLTDAALSANQGRVLKDMIDSANLGEFDLSGYSKTSHTHSNYSVTSHTHSNYSTTGHTHTIANIDNLQSTLDGKSGTGHTHTAYSPTGHTHSISNITNLQSTLDGKSGTGHTHSYASTVKVGTTSYNVNSNIISIPAYPTLSTLGGASLTDLENHTANTTAHITSTERTNWNDANTKKHTHSNKSVLDGITSTKVSNWDKVYEDWNDVFTIDANGNLKVKVNLIGEKEVSAYGSGSSTSTGAITIVDNLTSTLTDAALSANQGRVLKDLIDSANFGEFDLSDYSKTSHTHSNYSVTSHTHSNYSTTGHTHSIANITNLQSTLDGKSGTGHTHSAYSPTSHTHSNYSVTSHTHSNYSTTGHTHSAYYDSAISRTKNTVLAAPNGSDGTATFRSLVAADIPSLAISKITNLQSSLDAKSGTGHSHSNYSPTGHTHSISNITNLQSTLDGKSGTGHSHSNYSVTSHTHSLSALTSTAHTHSVIVGSYTSNGGQQAPNYFGKNRVGALMMNTTVNGNSDYKDWLFMDCYSGNDVGGGVAFGVNRQNLGAYIMRSASGRTSWAASAELIGTHNYTKYCATSGHTHNYAGSSSAGGAATSANKVNSSLSWSGYNSGSFNGSGAASFVIPSNTNQLTNGANFITTAATVNAANKLATARTLWGQSFSGTANVSGNMTGVGSISASGNITTSAEVTAHSDKRLKDNIQPLENRGYITPYTYIKDGKQSIGFIAQDMQELYPELVSVDESTEEKYLSVNYMQYTAVLQQQIIDLKKEIDELKQIIKEIKK